MTASLVPSRRDRDLHRMPNQKDQQVSLLVNRQNAQSQGLAAENVDPDRKAMTDLQDPVPAVIGVIAHDHAPQATTENVRQNMAVDVATSVIAATLQCPVVDDIRVIATTLGRAAVWACLVSACTRRSVIFVKCLSTMDRSMIFRLSMIIRQDDHEALLSSTCGTMKMLLRQRRWLLVQRLMAKRYAWIFQLRSEHTRRHQVSTLAARQRISDVYDEAHRRMVDVDVLVHTRDLTQDHHVVTDDALRVAATTAVWSLRPTFQLLACHVRLLLSKQCLALVV